jgi:adenine-specific DNA-methyltransferase
MSRESSVDDPFLARQLIPYLGNKRALLRHMRPVFESIIGDTRGSLFLDPFAGSGSVSRLARSMGMAVRANDWEPYSESINRCWLELAPADLDSAFAAAGGIEDFLLDWNRMHPLANHGGLGPVGSLTNPAGLTERRYMSRWYAPVSTEQPDLDAERLFYSAENALFIDRVRYRLEDEYPARETGSPGETRRRVILGAILLEAATHTNTSGVFKAYHRGFGGHGSDALHRILARMELEAPLLVDAPAAIVHREDAASFCSRYSADLAYIDPPYNQHQYGANYHILNTIVRWDGQPQPLDRGDDGRLLRKAGIPGAAGLTKSPYCSRKGATSALAELFNALDCAAMVVSWNGDAHLSATELAEMLSARGELRIEHLDHASYRGGRQSASRLTRSSEYLFIVDCRKPPIASRQALSRLAREQALERALGASYDPARLRRNFKTTDYGLLLDLAMDPDTGMLLAPEATLLPIRHLRKLEQEARAILGSLQEDELLALLERLGSCVCTGVVDELDVLAETAAGRLSNAPGASQAARREAPRLIRKLAHRKYQDDFRAALLEFRGIAIATSDRILSEALDELERIATARFSYDPLGLDSRK